MLRIRAPVLVVGGDSWDSVARGVVPGCLGTREANVPLA